MGSRTEDAPRAKHSIPINMYANGACVRGASWQQSSGFVEFLSLDEYAQIPNLSLAFLSWDVRIQAVIGEVRSGA